MTTNRTGISIEAMIKELRREIQMRHRVYYGTTQNPGQVERGRMTAADADAKIKAMEATVDLLTQIKASSGPLFMTQQPSGPLRSYAIDLEPMVARQTEGQDIIILAHYLEGYLYQIDGIETLSRKATKPELPMPMPLHVDHIDQVRQKTQGTWRYRELDTPDLNQKIALFCVAYQNHNGEQYKVRKLEVKRWRDDFPKVPAELETLMFYMATKQYPIAGPKGILDYLKHYDATRQLMAQSGTSSFPDSYDKPLMEKLAKTDTDRYQQYRAHLVLCGYERVQLPGGETWRKRKSQ